VSGPAIIAALDPARQSRRLSALTPIFDYWVLTKPEVNFLILITTLAGFYLSCANATRPYSFTLMFNILLGTLLVASGSGTLNQYIERDFDRQMRRTAYRPAAAGRLKPHRVLAFGITLSAAGTIYLAAASPLACVVALLTMPAYLFLYTPLKRRTPLCVLVGALPGAAPPLIGWVGASGRLCQQAWVLYSILFLWQFPHFMSIAWMYREDYDRAGYSVLPKNGARSACVILQTILPLLGLIAVSMLHFPSRHPLAYCCAAILLSLAFLYFGLEFALQQSAITARRLLVASIAYLPLLYILRALLCTATRI